MLGAFGVVTVLSTPGNDLGDLASYRGLFWRRPVIAGIFTVMLLSLAGIPLTAGFIGKFYVVAAGASALLWVLCLAWSSRAPSAFFITCELSLHCTASRKCRRRQSSVKTGGVFLFRVDSRRPHRGRDRIGCYPSPVLRLIQNMITGSG